MSDSISPAKAEANQRNARKSTGPKDTTSTRLNATKHGLLAQGITELDDAEAYTALLRRLNHAHRPVGDIEAFLVERIALAMVRLRRIARMEAEYITGALHSLNLDNEPREIRVRIVQVGESNPPAEDEAPMADPSEVFDRPVIEPGLPALMSGTSVEALAVTFQRYESAMENKLYRAMNQLERLQRMRQGEHVSAPASVDVAVHAGGKTVASFGN